MEGKEELKSEIIKIMNESNVQYWDESEIETPEMNDEQTALANKINDDAAEKIIKLFNK